MNRLLMARTAIAGLFACGTAMAQSFTNTPALFNGPVAYAAGESETPSVFPAFDPASSVDLGGAGYFVILTETGITDVPASDVTGNIGVSPITGAADHLTCPEVHGKIYSVDDTGPARGQATPRPNQGATRHSQHATVRSAATGQPRRKRPDPASTPARSAPRGQPGLIERREARTIGPLVALDQNCFEHESSQISTPVMPYVCC